MAYANWQCPCPYGNPHILHMNNIEVNKRKRRRMDGRLTYFYRHETWMGQECPRRFNP